MVQLKLPSNSKVTKGKFFKSKEKKNTIKLFNIYRYDPDLNENPRIDSYELDTSSCGPMILSLPFPH